MHELTFANESGKPGDGFAAIIAAIQHFKGRHGACVSLEDQAAGQVTEYLENAILKSVAIKAAIDKEDNCVVRVLSEDGEVAYFVVWRTSDGMEVEVDYNLISEACTSDYIKAVAYDYDSLILRLPNTATRIAAVYKAMLLSYSHALRISDLR